MDNNEIVRDIITAALMRGLLLKKKPGFLTETPQDSQLAFVQYGAQGRLFGEGFELKLYLGISENALTNKFNATSFPKELVKEHLNMIMGRIVGELVVRGNRLEMDIPSTITEITLKLMMSTRKKDASFLSMIHRDLPEEIIALNYSLRMSSKFQLKKAPTNLVLKEPGEFVIFSARTAER